MILQCLRYKLAIFMLQKLFGIWLHHLSIRQDTERLSFCFDISDPKFDISDPKFDVSGLFFVFLLSIDFFCVFLHRLSEVEATLSGICDFERRRV